MTEQEAIERIQLAIQATEAPQLILFYEAALQFQESEIAGYKAKLWEAEQRQADSDEHRREGIERHLRAGNILKDAAVLLRNTPEWLEYGDVKQFCEQLADSLDRFNHVTRTHTPIL